MANWIYKKLMEEQIRRLVNSFDISEGIFKCDDNSLIHPGEFGTYRETICREFLSFFIPRSLGISTGFVISPDNEVSTQCDIIIFDENHTPLIQEGDKQRFFPIESVVAVGEIKSTVTKKELTSALVKLSKIKEMRQELTNVKIIKSHGRRNQKKFSTSINRND